MNNNDNTHNANSHNDNNPFQAPREGLSYSAPVRVPKRPPLGVHYKGVQSEGGALDGGSII